MTMPPLAVVRPVMASPALDMPKAAATVVLAVENVAVLEVLNIA